MEDFEAIYVQHFDGVYKYVFSLCRNETMAEEITQETFYRAMEHIDKFEENVNSMCGSVKLQKTHFLHMRKTKTPCIRNRY